MVEVPEAATQIAKTLRLDALVGESCLAVFDGACARTLLSKALGYGVVVGSSLVKVPQIAKVARSRSAFGLSRLSLLLEALGYAITVAYCHARAFPFSTYGESVFLLLQDAVLAVLIAVCARVPLSRALPAAVAACAAVAGAILSRAVPLPLLALLQAGTIPIFCGSKVPQIVLSWRNGSTGQLALATYALNFAGSLARVFTTLSELDDAIVLAGFVLGAVLNGVITAQILFYSFRSSSEKKKN